MSFSAWQSAMLWCRYRREAARTFKYHLTKTMKIRSSQYEALIFFVFPTIAMGYDLHITKAGEWSQSSQTPISEVEWKSAVAADGLLKMDTTATAANPQTREIIQVSNPLMAAWIDPKTNDKHYFYYHRGEISVKNPSENAIKKMKELAVKLDAQVLGDEGEQY
ncbi:hypothetical protein GCN78_18040 [Janthinobacterium rivuli]|uniref:hypothetical protein n=1 Tax=Janthinobacterium sp. FT68W TaxID=2654255 RepID=UPI00126403CB|nr:hypothetical protein [Janthinobacterium sp. FT68W]KAB8048646.1 hypothetical protein GCN78_18040 [Janthinobacterium sp. FT68W]